MKPSEFILASSSPRRKFLLSEMGINFNIVVSDVIENDNPRLNPEKLVLDNALLKAKTVSKKFKEALVLGSDTTILFKGKIYSKPKDFNEASNMLMEFSSNWHEVYTCIALIWHNGCFQEHAIDKARVKFKELDFDTIKRYHKIVYPLDKSGGYGIQEEKDMIVEKIEGSIDTIMGLPKNILSSILNKNKYNFSI